MTALALTQTPESGRRGAIAPVIAGLVALFIVICAIVPAVIAPFSPLAVHPNAAFSPPSLTHPFGTDESGRDILSRAIYGARDSLRIGVLATALGLSIGSVLGMLSGLLGRVVAVISGRLIELLFAFPALLLALLIIVVTGPGPTSVVVAVGLSTAPGYARIIQGRALSVAVSGHVESARVLGHSPGRIMRQTIIPNTAAPLVVLATLGVGQAVVWAASLSYLGLGAQPPSPEWGAMLNAGRTYLQTAPWMTIMPGILIVATTISLTVLGRHLARRTGERQ